MTKTLINDPVLGEIVVVNADDCANPTAYSHSDLISKSRAISWAVEDEPSGVMKQLSQGFGPLSNWKPPPRPAYRESRPINRVRNFTQRLNRRQD